jgi:hypothetical protein
VNRATLRALHRNASHGWPPGFPVAQFPNAPLLVALAAALVSRVVRGRADDVAGAVFYVALGVWAWQEAADGVNWFRRLLGVAGLAYVVLRLTDRLSGA